MKPFRWDIRKREQLGRLLDGDSVTYPEGYEEPMIECAAQVLARSAGRRLVFVGRSPETFFDYLSGVFDGLETRQSNLQLLNISNRFQGIEDIRRTLPRQYTALKAHFRELKLSPGDIIHDPDGVCLTDLVCSGGTFEQLFDFLMLWAGEEHADQPAMLRKLAFLGITARTKNSPNTWRWQQHTPFVKNSPQLTVKNISIDHELWCYLGNTQPKVSLTNPPDRWAEDSVLLPPRDERNLHALRETYRIYQLGRNQKLAFSERLAKMPEFQEAWLRGVVRDLRGGC